MLPNLIIIGAPKCGTTALYYYLAHHPEVFMSRMKELRFFDLNWDRGIDWYAAHFEDAGGQAVRGEASPQYAMYPAIPGVPERMHSIVPDAKLVYLVRDPIDRLASRWMNAAAGGRHPRLAPFEEAVPARADHGWVAESMYALQLDRYLRHYARDRILVIDRGDLLDGRRETLRRVFRFLGVDETFDSPRFDEVRNPSSRKRRMRIRGPLIPQELAPASTGRLSWDVRRRVKGTLLHPLSAPVRRPSPGPEHRAALEALLRPDAERLRELTGQGFADWTV